MFRNVLNFRYDYMPTDYYWSSSVAYVYRRSATLVYAVSNDFADALRHSDLTPVGQVEPIGPWRVQWWRLNPNGYRLVCRPVSDYS